MFASHRTGRKALLLGSLLFLACGQPTESGQSALSEEDREAIRALLDEQRDAWNERDLEGYMAGYHQSEDIVFTSGGKVRRGYEAALRSYSLRYVEGGNEMGTLAFSNVELTALGADSVLAMGRFELSETPHAGGGVFSLVITRRDEGWGIWHDHSSADPDPPKSAPVVPDRRVAVTIDDLPLADASAHEDDAARLASVQALCEVFKAHSIPVTGFVNMKKHEAQPELMEAWKDCGIQFGNHTYSHLSPDKVELETYLADLRKGHEALLPFVEEGASIPFRYPYLSRGKTSGRNEAIKSLLAELESEPIPVTIDTWDWLYNSDLHAFREAHPGKLNKPQTLDQDALRKAWMWNLQEATFDGERLARDVFDREPPQILLIHANELNARHLGAYFDWLEGRGYRYIDVDMAMADPAYTEEQDTSVVPTGDSWWLRVRRARALAKSGREPFALLETADDPPKN